VSCAKTAERTDRFAVLVVDSGGPKEAEVQSYSPCGANVHKFNPVQRVAQMCPTTLCRELCDKRSAVAEMGDRLATIDMG